MTTGTSHTKAKRRRRNEEWSAEQAMRRRVCDFIRRSLASITRGVPAFEVEMHQPVTLEDHKVMRVNIRHGDSELAARMEWE